MANFSGEHLNSSACAAGPRGERRESASSKYLAYSEYKDSGVEWFGNIPQHWFVAPLKWQIERNDGGVWGDDPDEIDDTIVLRSTEQTVDGNWKLDDPAPRKLSPGERASALLKEGDLLVTKSSGSSLHIGKTTLVTTEIEAMGCCYSNFMQRIRTKSSLIPKLAWYVMNNDLARRQFDFLSNSTTGLANLNGTMMGQIFLALPNVAEQAAIANFLDHETAKIDTLIEKQQQLIQLLKEKRQAVISHAVTKGLNPDVPMKDSGVEWLGEVPEGWEIKKFSHCVAIRNGLVDPTAIPYKDYVLIAPNHIESETGVLLSLETANEQGADSGKFLCKKGEVLYSKIRPALAKACISPSDETICSADMYPMQGMAGLSNEFLFLSLLSNWFTSLVVLESDRVAMPKINREKLADIRLPIPPQHEQETICLLTKTKITAIDHLLDKAHQAIMLMQERRTALISAAVTGKIDVRLHASRPTGSA